MNSHVSAILLGVGDMERSKRFYTDPGVENTGRLGHLRLFRPRTGDRSSASMATRGWPTRSAPSRKEAGFSGVVFNYVVRSEARVDAVMEEAEKAGPRSSNPPPSCNGAATAELPDPDGYVWRIGYSDQGKDQPYAE